MLKNKKSLAETHPEVAKQWHPTKNNPLTPYDVTFGSGKKVWWKCPKGDDHEYITSIGVKSKGIGCSVCSGRTIVTSNCLATINPNIAKQWHPTKNNPLTPYDVGAGSGKKVWWKCPKGDDHEWKSQIYSRVFDEDGCPYCSGRYPDSKNNLLVNKPEIAKQWHPTKNGDLTPNQFKEGSNKKVWWKCPKGDDHEWEASPNTRNRSGCPFCSGQRVTKSNSIFRTHPKVAKQWHPTKNGDLTPYDVTFGSGKKVWWKCPKGDDHEWDAMISNICKGDGCPFCSGHRVTKSTSLAFKFPNLIKEWHPTLNKKFTPHTIGYSDSNNPVWWKCVKSDEHIWKTSVRKRTIRGTKCPYCEGQKADSKNNLVVEYPKIAREWHPEKNGNKLPKNYLSGSGVKVWWKCPKGDDHEWKTSIEKRTSGTGCPVCDNKKIVQSNCLATTHPKVAKQWHPTKNGKLTIYDIHYGYRKKVWWKCDKGDDHEWRVSPSNRKYSNTGCPYCTLTPQSRQELTITFELMKLFNNIDPKGLKTRLNGRLRAIDIFIPKLNLCIEFDGAYWHKDKQNIDKIKSEMLFEEGFKLIRVREEPLPSLYDTDVISKQPYDGKQVTNDILSMILSIFELDDKLVSKIKDYQSKDVLQNEKGLDKYIEKILTEKAKKNGNI